MAGGGGTGNGIGRRAVLGRLGAMVTLAGALPAIGRAAPALQPVTHQLGWLKGVQFGGDLMAIERGYFTEEGIEARYMAGGPGTDYRTLVAAGRTMVSESNALGVVDGAIQGQPLIAFAAVMQRNPGCFLSSRTKPVKTLADMVGKTIGLPNNIRTQVTVLLRRAGIDPYKVRFVPVGTDPGMLVAGQVDAYWGWATTAGTALRAAGFDPYILYLADLGIRDYGELLIARPDTLAREHDLFVRYTRALVRGWRWAIDNPDETARIVVAKYAAPGTSLARQTVEAALMKSYVLTGDALTEGLLWVAPEPFEAALALGREGGSVPPGIRLDAASLVTQSVIRAALGKA